MLVAEDRWTNRALLCRLLRAVGFTVIEAEKLDPEQTGAVIEQIRASAPDLADGLGALVRSFDFDQLLRLTDGV